MLHEIFKGMDNASEAINENFLSGSIIDSGETNEGSYIKFGNGFCVQFIKFNHVRPGHEQTVDYIIPLKDGLSASMTTLTGVLLNGRDINNTLVYPYTGSFFKYTKGKGEWEGSSPFPVIVTIWGMYK